MKVPEIPWLSSYPIAAGTACIGLSFFLIISPSIAFGLVVIYLSVSILIIGIPRAIAGAVVPGIGGKERAMNIGIGAISIVVAAVILAFPHFVSKYFTLLFILGLISHAFG